VSLFTFYIPRLTAMNIDKAREYVTHRLNNELSDGELRELAAFIAEHPEFEAEVRAMEQAWKRLGVLEGEAPSPPMSSGLRERLEARSAAPAPRFTRRLAWIGAVAAALLLLLGSIAYFRSGGEERDPGDIPVAKEDGPIDRPQEKSLPDGPVDSFAGLAFPDVDETDVVEGPEGNEPAGQAGGARLLRARGLVVMRGPDDRRWSLLRRGDDIKPNERVRVPANPDFGAVIVGDHGSTISLAAGGELRRIGPREWELARGSAWFVVAKTHGKAKFTVRTRQGRATALSTAFGLAVVPSRGDPRAQPNAFCEVEEGEVALVASAPQGSDGQKMTLGAGKTAWMAASMVEETDARPGSRDWLVKIQKLSEADEAMASLVAEAEEEGKKLPLEIKSYGVDVTVVDGVARTFLDMVFVNHTDRRLEGTFYYSVPADATISEFAMYVGTQRIVGEVLEQHRARQIYEYIRREQRDPALLEWAGGNLFKMRVFPIEPRSDKRIQLGYTEVLPRVNGQVNYTFPLMSEMLKKNPLQDLSLKVKVLSSPGIIDLKSPTHRVRRGLSKDRTRGALAFHATNYTPVRDFRATWLVPEESEFVVRSNRRPDEPEGYFMAQVAPTVEARPREIPERVLIVADESGSIGPQSFSVTREFSAALVEMIMGWDYNVVRADQKPTFMHPDFEESRSGDYERVNSFLDERTPIGGTDLLAIFGPIARALPEDGDTRIIYVGDGIDTLGRLERTGLVEAIVKLFEGKEVELNCVSIGSSYDKPVLRALAEQMGGTFRAVRGVNDVFEAADSILEGFCRPVLREVEVTFEGLEAATLYPPRLGTLAKGEVGLTLGRIVSGREGKALVTGLADGKSFRREYPVSLSLPEDKNRFLPRLWAKAHMDNLRAQMGLGGPKRDAYLREQIIATSLRYQIMSPFTAFLVLESEEDYKKFGVTRRLRMVDWKGELDNAPQGISKGTGKKPKPKRVARGDLGSALLPEPPLALVPAGEELEVWRIVAKARTSLPVSVLSAPVAAAGAMGGGGAQWSGQTIYHSRPGDLVLGDGEWPISGFSERSGSGDEWGREEGKKGFKLGSQRLGDQLTEFLGEVDSEDQAGDVDEVHLYYSDPTEFNEKRPEASSRLEPDEPELPIYDARDLLTPILEYQGRGEPLFAGKRIEFGGRVRPVFGNNPLLGRLFRGRHGGRYSRRSTSAVAYGHYVGRQGHNSYLHRYGIKEVSLGEGRELRLDGSLPHEAYLRRAAKARPGSAQDRLDFARALLRNGKYQAALAELDAALEGLDSPHLLLERAWLLAQTGKKDAAQETVLEALSWADRLEEGQGNTLRERCADSLARLGEHEEASRILEKLADASDDEERAARLYDRAYRYARNIENKDAAAVWGRALRKWPESATVHSRAASSLQNVAPERALQLAEKARELGAETLAIRASILLNMGKGEEALSLLQRSFGQAESRAEAYQALYACHRRDWARARQWTMTGLEKGRGPQMEGAVQFARSYNVSNQARRKILELALRDDFPADLRLPAFYALHRHGGRNERWARVLLPLLQRPKTGAAQETAISAFQQLASYGYYQIARPHLEALAAFKPKDEQWQYQLAYARWQVEWNTGKQKEALDHAEAAFRACRNPSHAYNLANAMLHALVNRGEAERAVRMVADMLKRFPGYVNSRYLYQNLYHQLRSRNQLALLKQFHKDLEEARATQETRELTDRYQAIIETLKKKDYAEVDAKLEEFDEALVEKRTELVRAVREAGAELSRWIKERESGSSASDEGGKVEQAAEEAPAAPKEDTDKGERLWKALHERVSEFATATALLRQVRGIRAVVTSRSDTVRAKFLASCSARAQTEDPVWREWTSASLTCLRSVGKREEYRDALKRLRQSEPDDALWPRLLVNAHIVSREVDEAHELLESLIESDPDEITYSLSSHALIEATGSPDEITAARAKLWPALRTKPGLLQQLASHWQGRQKTDLAVEAYLTLQDAPGYESNAWPVYQAGQLLKHRGEKRRAAEFYLRILKEPGWAQSQGSNAVTQLQGLITAEEILFLVEKELASLLDADEAAPRNWSLLLAYHCAKARGKSEDAGRALDALQKVPPAEFPGLAQQVVSFLAQEQQYDRLDEYVRRAAKELGAYQLQTLVQNAANGVQPKLKEQGRALTTLRRLIQLTRDPVVNLAPHSRRQLLWHLASSLGAIRETRGEAIAVCRELTEIWDSNVGQYHSQVINWLIDEGKESEAIKELDRMPFARNDWNLWHAHRRVINHVGDKKRQYGQAARLAYECWKKWDRSHQSYGGNVFDLMTNMCWRAVEAKQLPEDVRKALVEEIQENAKHYFQGAAGRSYTRGRLWNCSHALGLIEQHRKMAEAASTSDDPQRISNAAQFYFDSAQWPPYDKTGYAVAVKIFRRLLDLGEIPHNLRGSALSSLYNIYANYTHQWDEALEVLEPWKESGKMRHEQYLDRRAYCLYKLKRNEEGRKVARELLQTRNYRRNYWMAQNLARYCRGAGDYTTEVECLEHGMRWMRLTRRLQPNYVSQFYVALANAYGNLGEKERAYEAFLRGMSLLNRNSHSSYYNQLMNSLMDFLKRDVKGGLDEMVARYEKHMRSRGELPHLRVAFAQAFRRQGRELESLHQYAIAADLLPKDTALRKEAIEGYKRLGRHQLAEQLYLSWARLDPQNLEIYQGLGDLYEGVSQPGKAMLAYATMAEARPREAEGHRAHGKVLAGKGKLGEAATAYEKAVRYRPTEFAIASELASVHEQIAKRTGEADVSNTINALWQDGESACRQAMETLPDDPLPWLDLARFLKAQGKQAEAKELLNEILARDWPRFGRATRDAAVKIRNSLD